MSRNSSFGGLNNSADDVASAGFCSPRHRIECAHLLGEAHGGRGVRGGVDEGWYTVSSAPWNTEGSWMTSVPKLPSHRDLHSSYFPLNFTYFSGMRWLESESGLQ